MPYTWNIPQSKVVFQVRQFLSLDLPNIFSVCPSITGLPLCFSLFGSISSVLSSADFLLTHLFLRFLSDHRCFFLCEWVWIFCCPNLSQGQFHVSQYYGCAGVLDWNLFLKTLSIKQYINTRNKKIYTFLCLAPSELFIFLNRSILEANYLHQIFCFPHTCEAYNKLISKLLLDYTLLCHQRRRNCFILKFSEVFLVIFYWQYFNCLNQNKVNDFCDFSIANCLKIRFHQLACFLKELQTALSSEFDKLMQFYVSQRIKPTKNSKVHFLGTPS